MIQFLNLGKSFGEQNLFAGANINIGGNDRIGIVGRNGSGKTTLFRLIIGEEKPETGSISIPKGYRTGYLNQHIQFQKPTILEESALGLPAEDKDCVYRAEKILLGLGFSLKNFEQHPSQLSGGYAIRLHLAKLLLSDPDLLLLDEPTNYLDIVSIRWLEAYLRSWKRSLLLITHDRSFMDRVVNCILGIHRQRLKKIVGDTQKYYTQNIEEETTFEKTRINHLKKQQSDQRFVDRFRAQATKAAAVQSRVKRLEKSPLAEKLGNIQKLAFKFNGQSFAGKVMVNCQAVSFSYSSKLPNIIEGLDFVLGRHEKVGIIGKNGKGKSTLMQLFAQQLAPSAGKILLHEKVEMGYFGQMNIDRLDLNKTLEQEVGSGANDFNKERVRAACGLMMFGQDAVNKTVNVLSGGEKSRVLLAKILLKSTNLLLLDEPSNHLDMESIEALISAVNGFEGSVLIITHNEGILHAVAERLIVFRKDKVECFPGTYQDFLDQDGWSDNLPTKPLPLKVEKAKIDMEKGGNRKLQRKIRSDLTNERSKVLNPLKNKMKTIESQITSSEEGLDEANRQLIVASGEQNGPLIIYCSKVTAELNLKIEKLYSELEIISAQVDEKEAEFDEKLKNIE